jgi:nitronate monooxygenase
MSPNLKRLLNIDLPIIQAPMAGVQDSALAAAVSNAGGLGMLPCAMLDLQQCRQELQKLQEATDRPFGVNFFAHVATQPDALSAEHWRALFAPYYQEFEVPVPDLPVKAARMPFDANMAELVEQFRPAVVSFHFGLPAPDLLALVRQTGAVILSSATTVQEAMWLEQHGVDAIIVQGVEAGGHRGMFLSDDIGTQIGTLPLLNQVVAAVRVPVIAAGGIASAEAVRAVLSMGAVAAQVGTAYLLCHEAKTSAVHRRALSSGHARHTVLTNIFTGRPARGIVNRMIREFPHATFASSALRTRAESLGCEDFTPLWSGQDPSGCQEVSAAQLTRGLAGLV